MTQGRAALRPESNPRNGKSKKQRPAKRCVTLSVIATNLLIDSLPANSSTTIPNGMRFALKRYRKRCVNMFTKLLISLFAILGILIPAVIFGHCDTVFGPVVADAKLALESGEITPVLKWVKKEYEPELKESFQNVLAVRGLNPAAKELADRSFFETLVRLHRAGEGAPYTGLTSEPLESVIEEADQSLDKGSISTLSKVLTTELQTELQHRFHTVLEKKKVADQSAEAGRQYVEAYVAFVHYVEAVHQAAGVEKKHSH
jgi:hypothetical protein